MGSIRLTLLCTAVPGRPGSMRRYAELVQAALASLPEGARPTVTLVSLHPTQASGCVRYPRLANWLHHAACAVRVRGELRQARPDLLHILDGSHAYLANLLQRRQPVVTTVHDLIPLLTARGELPGPRPSAFARCLWRLSLSGMARCRGIVAVSEHTRRDLARLSRLGANPVVVVRNAICTLDKSADASGGSGRRSPTGDCSPSPRPSAVASTCSVDGPPPSLDSPPLILHLGNNATYKNRAGVLRVGALVLRQRPVRLVLAGPRPTQALRRLAAELGITEHVEWRPDIADAEVDDLYRHAAVFLFPSLYEGFGWPPLEAMACGCPVVCSNAASLPEVVGDAALLAAPEDHAALAGRCLDVLSRPEIREELVRRGHANTKRFALEQFGVGLLDVYRRALGAP